MKLILASLLLVFLLVGAAPRGEKSVDTGKGYTIKTIEECEYIEYDYGILNQRVYSLTHKGNCKNPKHFCPATIVTR